MDVTISGCRIIARPHDAVILGELPREGDPCYPSESGDDEGKVSPRDQYGLYTEDPDNAAAYEARALECLASWLTHDYASTALNTEHGKTDTDATTGETVRPVFRYGAHGYIKAATGAFHTTIGEDVIDKAQAAAAAEAEEEAAAIEQEAAEQAAQTDDPEEAQAILDAAAEAAAEIRKEATMERYQQFHENIHVGVEYDADSDTCEYDARCMDMDCCTFASLITKCYTYEDSIYRDVVRGAYDNAKALDQATFAYRSDRLTYLGHDANNNVTTDEWAEGLFYSGVRFRLFSTTEYGKGTTIYPKALEGLRSGDLVFFGIGNVKREAQFLGIHHIGIYVKDLKELEQYAPGYTFHISQDTNGSEYTDGQYGYMVHVYGHGSPRYVNVLRVDTLEFAARYYEPREDRPSAVRPEVPWHYVYVCHVVPNTINTAGGMEASTSWRNAWGKAYFSNWHDTGRFFSIRSYNGGVHTTSLGQSGFYLANGVDFNSMIENGLYRFSSNTTDNPISANSNMPIAAMGFLEVEGNPVTDRFRENGVNSVYFTTQTYTAFPGDNYMVVYRRWINAGGTAWSPWYKVWDAADVAGDTSKSKPAVVQSSTTVLPMEKKYF